MGLPIVLVDSGGIPVTESTNGIGSPVTVSTNGLGIAATLVASGGMPVVGAGSLEPTDPIALFAANPALNLDDTNANTTFWTAFTLNSEDVLDEIRVTISPAGTNTLTCVGVGIVKFPASTASQIGALTNMTFSSGTGFTSKTTDQTSDWISASSLGLSPGDKLLVAFTTGGSGQASTKYNNFAYVADTYFKAGTSWNDPATVLDTLTKLPGYNYAVAKVETRGLSGGGGTPPAENDIPMSFDDPMFSAMTEYPAPIALSDGASLSRMSVVTASGDPAISCSGTTTVSYCRVNAREAARATASQTFHKCYIEAQGLPDVGDHADTLQIYSPGQVGGALVVTNSHLRGYTIDATANLFCADNWSGSITLQDVIIQGGPYGTRIDADNAHVDISFENVYFVGPFGTAPILFQNVGTGTHTILQWDNVREATIVNGVLVPGALIPNPG